MGKTELKGKDEGKIRSTNKGKKLSSNLDISVSGSDQIRLDLTRSEVIRPDPR